MKADDLDSHLSEIESFLASELSKMRSGRATTSLVDDIMVVAYDGADPLPVKELGMVSADDPLSITITPWDKSILEKIETAIRKSGRGFNPVNDGQAIRVPVPPMTEETRRQRVKEISALVEQSKIKVRTIRKDVIKSVEEMEDTGTISEDDMFSQKKQIEEAVSQTNQKLEKMGKDKEAELMRL